MLFLSILIFATLISAFCGDGLIDPDGKENCATCPRDSPCNANEQCIEGSCEEKFFPPLFIKEDPEATIIISREIADKLNQLFNSKIEFAACLQGKYGNGVYQITKMKMAKAIEQSSFHIRHEACPKLGTISAIHSHPGGDCKLSETDIFAFGSRDEPTNAVVCGRDNFAFYSREDFNKRMNYIIKDIEYKDNLYIIIITIGLIIIVAGAVIAYDRFL